MANEFIARNGVISKSNIVVSGSLTALSSIVAQTLVVQTITSSVSSITGSTNFGTLSSNTHTFTGSINASGSATFSGSVTSNGTLTAGLANGNIRLKGSTDGFLGVGESNGLLYLADWSTATKGLVINLSSGNVGIGTSSPLAYSGYISLTIGNNASDSIGLLKFRSIYNSGDGAEIYQTTSGNLNFNINGSLGAMTISSVGKVGIGTSSPDNTYQGLTIYGTNPSLRLKSSDAGSWNWIEFVNVSGTNNFSMGVSQSTPIFAIKAGAGLDSPNFVMTSGGNVGIGIITPSDKLSVSAGQPSISIRYTSAGTVGSPNPSYIYFRDFTGSGDIRGGIYFQDQSFDTAGTNMQLKVMSNGGAIITSINMQRDGNVYNYNNSTAWATTSDVRVKENINTITNALNTIIALNPVTFDYKQNFADKNNWDEDRKLNNIGFIAQEFETVFPKFTHSKEEIIGDTLIEDFKTIDTGHLVPYLVKAIQELTARVQELENK